MVRKHEKTIKILLIFLVFIFTFSLRLWNFNLVGKTWDEDAYVRWGYNFIKLIENNDFKNPYWYKISASPPLSSYIYGIFSKFDIEKIDSNGNPIFNYDYTYTRLISTLVFSLTVLLVMLFCWKHISFLVGIFSGLILSLLPLSVAYSQLATLESLIILFFTATIFSFFNFLIIPSNKNLVLTGILLGLSLEVKYTNVLLYPLMIFIFLIWYFNSLRKILYIKKILAIFLIGFITFFVLWPMPWFHLKEVIEYNSKLRYSPHSVPEVFFGKLMLVPKVYYFVYFLITTPLSILGLFLLGLIKISNKKINFNYKFNFSLKKMKDFFLSFFLLKSSFKSGSKWMLYSFVVWFIFPFVQSFYNFRQHGIRYIIEIYTPLALISGIGLNYLLNIFKNRIYKIILFSIFFLSLIIILIKISPYYLDYFNLIVGGTRNVYNNRIFQLGWWGEGTKEAINFLEKNVPKGTKIGCAMSTLISVPPTTNFNISKYDNEQKYDYVVVSYFYVLREGFDDNSIKKNYKKIYDVNADGATLFSIYKHR